MMKCRIRYSWGPMVSEYQEAEPRLGDARHHFTSTLQFRWKATHAQEMSDRNPRRFVMLFGERGESRT